MMHGVLLTTQTLVTNGWVQATANKRHHNDHKNHVNLLDSIEFNPQWLLDLGVRWDKFNTEQVTNATGDKIENDQEIS